MKLKFLFLILTGFLIFTSFSEGFAQDESESEFSAPQKLNNRRRQNVLQGLQLTRNQIQQIRRINQENRLLLQAAQARLREASRNLDAAIYADNFNEFDVQFKMRELQTAQVEIIKLRTFKEASIRRVLEATQLSKFREARQSFEPQRAARRGEGLNQQTNQRNRKFINRARP